MRDDLEKLLNTRKGTVLIDPNFGLPDFTHLMNGYSVPDVDEIERDILQQIRDYDRRLSKLMVRAQDDRATGNSLGFGLTAVFDHKNQEQTLSAIISIKDNGSVGVSLWLWSPLKIRFLSDCSVTSLLESSCTYRTLRFFARCFLAGPEKSLFLEAP